MADRGIPGINRQATCVILVEIGGNVNGFKNAPACSAWAGVNPGNNESAGKRRHARSVRGNPHLRTVLVECALAAARTKNCQFQGYHKAIQVRRECKRATVATAHIQNNVGNNSVLITPPITANLLEGIVRRSILELARTELKVPVQEREIDRSELHVADEAFFCGTGVGMASIGSIDHRIVGNGKRGEITSQLDDLYQQILIGGHDRYMHWLTAVYI